MNVRLQTIITLSIVFAFFLALTSYVNSTFLESLFGSENIVNLLYSLGGLVSLITLAILAASREIRYALVALITIIGLSLVVLTAGNQPLWLLWIAAPIYLGISTGLIYLMDLLIEAKSPSDATGSVRGRYLAFQNAAWILAPILAGYLVQHWGNTSLYYIGIIITIILLGFVLSWRHVPTAQPTTGRERVTISERYHRRFSYLQAFVLNIFYAIMIVTSPVFLRTTAGWSWTTIGTAFTTMLIMFPIVQKPLGQWLDTNYKKYQLVASWSLVVMSAATIGIFVLAPISVVGGIVALCLTRVGAAALEIISDTQFFITTDSHDRRPIALYRAITPLSYIVGPLVVYLVASNHYLVFGGLSGVLGIVAVISIAGYLYERKRRSLTITPSSK